MFSTTTPPDALASSAEVEIDQQSVLPPSLCTKRNFLLPVFRLPPGALEIIFIHGARDFHESADAGYFTERIPTWVNVSYVCSHWRDVALNCPVLWTYHFNISQRWTKELLLRSKEASLKIFCNGRYTTIFWWQSFLDNLLKHSEHIQELRLCISSSCLPAKISLRPLCLEKLEIITRHAIPKPFIGIINGNNHSLRTLKLRHCSLQWFSLNLVGLRILSLDHVHSPSPPNMVQFLTVLSSMQNLTVLNLKRSLPSARDVLFTSGLSALQKFNLPRLSYLGIFAPVSTVIALLSHVSIPLRTQLDLEPLTEPGSSVGDFDPISSFFVQRFKHASAPIFHSLLLLDYGRTPCLGFGLELEPVALRTEMGERIPSPLRVTIAQADLFISELSESDLHRIITNIYCSVPLSNIHGLHVMFPHRFPSDFWREMLGYLDGLRYLKLSNGFMPNLSLLSLAACEPNENSDKEQNLALDRVLVPALGEMVLERITFGRADGLMSRESFFRTLSTRENLRDRVTMIECRVEVDSNDGSGPYLPIA